MPRPLWDLCPLTGVRIKGRITWIVSIMQSGITQDFYVRNADRQHWTMNVQGDDTNI